jgi:hypothetical protein
VPYGEQPVPPHHHHSIRDTRPIDVSARPKERGFAKICRDRPLGDTTTDGGDGQLRVVCTDIREHDTARHEREHAFETPGEKLPHGPAAYRYLGR